MRWQLLLCVLLAASSPAWSGRILAVLPNLLRSHFIFSNSVLVALADRGHQVTVYSPFSASEQHRNIVYIQVNTEFETFVHENLNFELILEIAKKTTFGVFLTKGFYARCEHFLKHEKIQELLHSGEKYDLVLSEATRGEESILVFGHIFQAPTVALWSSGQSVILNSLTGNALSIAHVPDYATFAFTNRMSFFERLKNAVSAVVSLTYYHFHHLPRHEEIVRRHVADFDIPPLEDLARGVSLTLVNTHPTVGYPQLFTPNMIPVGGVHIEPDKPSLPKTIAAFMDSAAEGVIYVSLGTMITMEMMPVEIVEAFTNAFARLPQKVLWKASPEKFPTLSENILAFDWVPQQSVLAHPNCRLFITHGGLFSQLEALDAGVPTVGLPIASDQGYNVRLYQTLGVGVGLDLETISEHTVYSAIQTVLGDNSFNENARHISEKFRLLPTPLRETAVHWVEYVMKHDGATHLTPASASLPLYCRGLLDVAAALAAFTLAVITVIFITCRKFWLLLTRRKSMKSKKID
uniref:UDP-glucuronosyltransferase n=1 Tax=Graphocephala atropunctata TaxID=36148 RepID=A0A1B6LY74_9HEMI